MFRQWILIQISHQNPPEIHIPLSSMEICVIVHIVTCDTVFSVIDLKSGKKKKRRVISLSRNYVGFRIEYLRHGLALFQFLINVQNSSKNSHWKVEKRKLWSDHILSFPLLGFANFFLVLEGNEHFLKINIYYKISSDRFLRGITWHIIDRCEKTTLVAFVISDHKTFPKVLKVHLQTLLWAFCLCKSENI